MGVGIHSVCRARCDVFHEAQAKWAATVLVALELADSGVGSFSIVESDNTGTTGSSTWLVLNLGLLNLSDSREELDQIIVTGRPGKLQRVSPREHAKPDIGVTYVSDVDGFRSLIAGGSKIGERIWRLCGVAGVPAVKPTRSATTGASSSVSSSTTAVAAECSATTTKSTSATVAPTKGTTSAKSTSTVATTATAADTSAGKPILADLEHTALPVVAVELLNRVASIFGVLKDDDTRSLRASILAKVNIRTNDRA